jgi:glutaredoxin-related protein
VSYGVACIADPSSIAFPQIILNGELIGGLDIFRESLENGEFDEMYAAAMEEPEKST